MCALNSIKGRINYERKYKNFSDPQNLILATMAQNEFLKESEVLADLIQKSLDKK